jgi:hypothetical protein
MLSLGLSLLGIGKNLMGWLTAGFKWIFASGERVAIALALSLCLWLYVGKSSALASAAKWKRTAESELALRIANEVAYKDAQKVAADLNKKQVESIKSQYAAIAERTEDEYEKRLADNRRSLTLWMQARTIDRDSKGTGTGSATSMPAEVVPGAAQTEFLVGAEDLEIASDNYSQLVALIEWAKSIGEVKPQQ